MKQNNNPQHPGPYLESVYRGLGLTKKTMAAKLNMSRTTLWKFTEGKLRLNPEMAAGLGKISGDGPAFWLNLQHEHDLSVAGKKCVVH